MTDPKLTPTEKKIFASLFSRLGLKSVILVEDQRTEDARTSFLSLCGLIGSERLEESALFSDFEHGADEAESRMRCEEMWEEWDSADRLPNYQKLQALAISFGLPVLNGKEDHASGLLLRHLIEKELALPYEELSRADWLRRNKELLIPKTAKNILFLFDRDLSKEGGTSDEGISLVKDVLSINGTVCGLITHTVAPGNEQTELEKISKEHHIKPARFLIISKQRLSNINPDVSGFIRQFRLLILNGRCLKLKDEAHRIFRKALKQSSSQIDSLTIHAFDKIVFESSIREGVWEADTLFRLFSNFMRRESNALSRSNRRFVGIVSSVRQISTVESLPSLDGPDKANQEVAKIQQMELFEGPEHINEYMLPIDLGDIFELTVGTKKKLLILAGQPCSLMVRPNGKRAYDGDKDPICLIEIKIKKGQKDNCYDLPFFDLTVDSQFSASFSSIYHISPMILDLCVLNKDGKAHVSKSSALPSELIEPWKIRGAKIIKEYQKTIDKIIEIHKLYNTIPDALLPKLVGMPGVAFPDVPFSFDYNTGSFQFHLVRIKRLRMPYSADLLQNFNSFNSRNGFEHFYIKPADDNPPGEVVMGEERSNIAQPEPAPLGEKIETQPSTVTPR